MRAERTLGVWGPWLIPRAANSPSAGPWPRSPLSPLCPRWPHRDDTTLRTGRELTPGTLPRPSISAEPGSLVPWGRPVSIVCRGPAGVRSFRLEKDNRYNYTGVAVTSGGEQETEARLHITALHKDNVGHYCCIYGTESGWSERSEALSLEGTEEAVSALPTGGSSESRPQPTDSGSQTAHTLQDHTLENGVRLGVAGMVLLILVTILAEAGHGQGRFQCRPQEWRPKGAPQRD
ncbi:leukocyte-associated immunoglobulin-like receptor 2 isoform X1 [Cervus canadensis]|uniref:leukocyte-associated immunoglobulin-like receptor 2 isoform X1 n=1 Tax=Cervus canadensis TaxID=1574408 RepID=UPI001CA36476|nr:leukocyte-associated immunoglobulin-like receptor 2 isoform X1 [Cervus canadensis]